MSGTHGAANRGAPPAAGEVYVARAFEERFGGSPALIVRAPGRANLLGEYADDSDGLLLSVAIGWSVWIALRPRVDRRVVVRSLDFGEEQTIELDRLRPDGGRHWIEYVKGTAWALGQMRRRLSGWEGVMGGEIPPGAGLAASAALVTATARAFLAASDMPWDPLAVARCGQRAEAEWVGRHGALSDYLIVSGAVEDHALLVDCREATTTAHAFPPGTAVVTLDTSMRPHSARASVNERRARCLEAARLLGVPSLRELSREAMEVRRAVLPEHHRRLVSHVVAENDRALEAAHALDAGEGLRLGELVTESDRSLRDAFGLSDPLLEALVVAAQEAGCHGARMTGRRLGCVVALADDWRAEEFVHTTLSAFGSHTGLDPVAHVFRPAAGASLARLE